MQAKRVNIVSIKMVKEASFLYAQRKISTPSDAVDIVKDFLVDSDREIFMVVCLTTKNEPTCCSIVSTGTLNASLSHPREIFKTAILSNSNSIILAHNHPSLGDPEPSKEDTEVTKRLQKAGKILGIEIIDHVIIGSNSHYMSFKERGLLG